MTEQKGEGGADSQSNQEVFNLLLNLPILRSLKEMV